MSDTDPEVELIEAIYNAIHAAGLQYVYTERAARYALNRYRDEQDKAAENYEAAMADLGKA